MKGFFPLKSYALESKIDQRELGWFFQALPQAQEIRKTQRETEETYPKFGQKGGARYRKSDLCEMWGHGKDRPAPHQTSKVHGNKI